MMQKVVQVENRFMPLQTDSLRVFFNNNLKYCSNRLQ